MSRYWGPALALLVAACSGNDKSRGAEDDAADSAVLDVFFPDTKDAEPDSDGSDDDVAPPEAEGETAPSDTSPPADTELPDTDDGPCDDFGCPCQSNADCRDELCIEGVDGFICTKLCATECPTGFDCLTVSPLGPDPLSLCVPRHVPLCRPCQEHDECSQLGATAHGFCLPADDPAEGSFCGTACSDARPCPEGYRCDEITLDDGGAVIQQCRPESGQCECRRSWATAPYETTCAFMNAFGACSGTRSCGPSGLTACDAPPAGPETCNAKDDDCNGVTDDIAGETCELTANGQSCPGITACEDGKEVCTGTPPTPEECNGVDDNCDGLTDEAGCFDGLPCTQDVCVGAQCYNDLQLGWCMIDGECFVAGQTRPDDQCQTCQPTISPSTFALADGIACDDTDPCTSADTCTAGQCSGEAYVCDDGLSCTHDMCDGKGGCIAPLAMGSCLIDGRCYLDGERSEPGSCLVCDSISDNAAWSGADGATCDDDDLCTSDDVCDGGTCGGTPFSCDDGDACTIDVCDGDGGCSHIVAEARCLISGVCYAAGTLKPGEPCFECDPDKSEDQWSVAAPGAPCDDLDLCTSDDQCQGGICKGTAYQCNDGLACTTDSCNGDGTCSAAIAPANCVIDGACVSAGTRQPTNACAGCEPSVSAEAWSPLDGVSCDDGDACTSGDSCKTGACSGSGYLCNDDNDCTTDSCNGDGTCTFTQAASSCIINGVCYSDGAKHPTEPCLVCRPDVSATTWSSAPSTKLCDDGLDCTTDDRCSAGTCKGTPYSCNDGLDCTDDVCNGDGTCTYQVVASQCAIGGACVDSGTLKTADGCLACIPSSSRTGWSARSGQPCDDGADCTHSDTCDGAACGGTPYTCDDDVACTTDSCDGDGTCTFALVGGVCLIDSTCHADGAQKSGEPCYACRPNISGTTWSPAVTGTECDDSEPCTKDDQCSGGICAGTSYECDDGLSCTTDSCDGAGGCGAEINPGSCIIDEACVANGTLHPSDSCLWCNPAVDANDWSARDGLSCDDDNACTHTDVCEGSLCRGTSYDCDDEQDCTSDSCNGDGTCGHAVLPGWCLIDDTCRSEDTVNPDDECLACRPSLATDDWRAVANDTPCDDGNACTKDDECTAGVCGGTIYSCDDGKICTTDQCLGDGTCLAPIDAGSCLIDDECYQDGETLGTGQDACLVCASTISQGSWYPNDDAPCDDGDDCTSGDACAGSQCGGASYDCDDDNACTLDSCDGDGTCTNVQATDTCLIAGECYAAGFPKPGEPCFACRPEISMDTWSAVASGSACDDGNACTHTDVCNGGSCAGTGYSCTDALTCTSESCNGDSTCTITIDSGSCLINGVCYADGAKQTPNGCLICDATQSPSAWFPNGGASCDDGQACTKDDLCTGSTCGGTAYSCDDLLACTADSCNGDGTCNNVQAANTCLIDGQCYAANTVKAGDPCLQCRPDLSATAWSAVQGTVSCDDGDPCSEDDTCSAGSCGGTPYVCNDGLSCTTDSCNGDGTCTATPNSGWCAIGGACFSEGTIKSDNDCKECNPSLDTSGWSNRAQGSSCDDGDLCTHTDQCGMTGVCAGTVYSCSDGLSCTSDACTGVVDGCTHTVTTGCQIGGACVTEGAFNPTNPCQQCLGATSRTTYSSNTGNSCEDADPCTHTDVCTSGSCGGTAFSCSDGLSCTSDVCNGNNTCSFPLISGNCLIDDACYANDATQPGNVCYKCTTASSTSVWSYNDGVSCDDGDACTSGDTCLGGVCEGDEGGDVYEPNETYPGTAITDTSDCTAPGSLQLQATYYPTDDDDWFNHYVDDTPEGALAPDVQLTDIPAGMDLDLEVYFYCADGGPTNSFTCLNGTRISGTNGCRSDAYGTANERVTISACCSGGSCSGDDNAFIWIFVNQWAGDPSCSDQYTLKWGNYYSCPP